MTGAIAVALIAGALTAGTATEPLVMRNAGNARADGNIDWKELSALNPDVVGWLVVKGTPISTPVVQPRPDDQRDFYLTHDLSRRASSTGTPYLDRRADPLGKHLLIFGHHVLLQPDAQFSPLQRAWQQEVFDGMEGALWFTPDGKVEEFEPLMALQVDMGYQPIQRFSFTGKEDLIRWVEELRSDASASSSTASAEGGRILTLCTCASDWAGQRSRTLVIFLEREG